MSYVEPVLPCFLILLALTATVLWRWRLLSRASVSVTAVLVFLWSWPPIAALTHETLEARYRPGLPQEEDAEAIVVLSAGILRSHPSRPYSLPDFQSYARTRYAAWLYHNWKSVPVVAAGGGGNPSQYANGEVIALVMAHILRSEQVPDDMVWTEDKSWSTHITARNCARMLQGRGITRVALVTDAHHMLRAELSFRKEGFEVIPAPCEFRDFDNSDRTLLIPSARALEYNERVLHEWLGLAWYRLRGYI